MRRIAAGVWGAVVGGIAGAGFVTPLLVAMAVTEGSQDFSHVEAMVRLAALLGAILVGAIACAGSPAVTHRAFQVGAAKGGAQAFLIALAGVLYWLNGHRTNSGSFASQVGWAIWFLILVGLPFTAFGSIIGGVRGVLGSDGG